MQPQLPPGAAASHSGVVMVGRVMGGGRGEGGEVVVGVFGVMSIN